MNAIHLHNARHANCAHDDSKKARRQCRNQARAAFDYDYLRTIASFDMAEAFFVTDEVA
jgi:hypothetical protein